MHFNNIACILTDSCMYDFLNFYIICQFSLYSRGTIHVKNLKSSTGSFSQRESLSLDDIDNLKVNSYSQQ